MSVMRKLKHHEKGMLKKVVIGASSSPQDARISKILRTYHIQKPEDYHKYNKVVGNVTAIVSRLQRLDAKDPYRTDATNQLLDKLYAMGIISKQKGLAVCAKLSVASFCRRRLPVVMVRAKMCQSLKEAVKLIEQGHVRVGPETIIDPAFLVTRSFEDVVTWVDGSKIRAAINKYNDKLDDFELLQS